MPAEPYLDPEGVLFLKRSRKHALAAWAWWQVLLASLLAFGLVGALPGLIPPISLPFIRLGLVMSLMAVVAAMANWWSYNWWARLALGVMVTLQFLAIGARAWSILVGLEWWWIVPAIGAYAVARALPLLRPGISSVLWREQVAPETRIGRLLLAIALGIGPSAGVIGASIGMFGSRAGELNAVFLVGGTLSATGSIGLAFALSYQLWPERPWGAIPSTDAGGCLE